MIAERRGESLRKKYMKDVYSQSWTKRRKNQYGFLQYDRNLCDLIISKVPMNSSLLDLAGGSGYPIADFLQKTGYNVVNSDISLNLLRDARSTNNQIQNAASDAEMLCFQNGVFDAVYCFHSTWYFPNLIAVVNEMLRVVKKDGLILFDIQNRNNEFINFAYEMRMSKQKTSLARIKRFVKNFARLTVGKDLKWRAVIYEIPTYPEDLYTCLNRERLDFDILGRKNDALEKQEKPNSFTEYDRLVFLIHR